MPPPKKNGPKSPAPKQGQSAAAEPATTTMLQNLEARISTNVDSMSQRLEELTALVKSMAQAQAPPAPAAEAVVQVSNEENADKQKSSTSTTSTQSAPHESPLEIGLRMSMATDAMRTLRDLTTALRNVLENYDPAATHRPLAGAGPPPTAASPVLHHVVYVAYTCMGPTLSALFSQLGQAANAPPTAVYGLDPATLRTTLLSLNAGAYAALPMLMAKLIDAAGVLDQPVAPTAVFDAIANISESVPAETPLPHLIPQLLALAYDRLREPFWLTIAQRHIVLSPRRKQTVGEYATVNHQWLSIVGPAMPPATVDACASAIRQHAALALRSMRDNDGAGAPRAPADDGGTGPMLAMLLTISKGNTAHKRWDALSLPAAIARALWPPSLVTPKPAQAAGAADPRVAAAHTDGESFVVDTKDKSNYLSLSNAIQEARVKAGGTLQPAAYYEAPPADAPHHRQLPSKLAQAKRQFEEQQAQRAAEQGARARSDELRARARDRWRDQQRQRQRRSNPPSQRSVSRMPSTLAVGAMVSPVGAPDDDAIATSVLMDSGSSLNLVDATIIDANGWPVQELARPISFTQAAGAPSSCSHFAELGVRIGGRLIQGRFLVSHHLPRPLLMSMMGLHGNTSIDMDKGTFQLSGALPVPLLADGPHESVAAATPTRSHYGARSYITEDVRFDMDLPPPGLDGWQTATWDPLTRVLRADASDTDAGQPDGPSNVRIDIASSSPSGLPIVAAIDCHMSAAELAALELLRPADQAPWIQAAINRSPLFENPPDNAPKWLKQLSRRQAALAAAQRGAEPDTESVRVGPSAATTGIHWAAGTATDATGEQHVAKNRTMHTVNAARQVSELRTDADREAFNHVTIADDLPEEVIEAIRRLLQEYSDIFAASPSAGGAPVPPRMRHWYHRILLRPDADLSKVRAGRRPMPPEATAEIDRMIEAFEQLGSLRRSRSTVSSHAMVVPKKDASGNVTGARITIDLRSLNAQTLMDQYPGPTPDELASKLGDINSERRSVMDIKGFFHAIPLHPASVPLTATVFGPGRFYEWLVAPMGLKSIMATAQRIVDSEFSPPGQTPIAHVYVDDIGKDHAKPETIVDDLRRIFDKCRALNLRLTATKARIGFKQIDYLGHTVGQGWRAPMQAKLDKIANWPTPTSAEELREFRGLCNFYHHFAPSLASDAAPLQDAIAHFLPLSKPLKDSKGKRVPFAWTDREQAAFDAVKLAMAQHTRLKSLHSNHGDLMLETDGSNRGAGWILWELQNEKPFAIIHCNSRAYTDRQQRWGPGQRELEAFRMALRDLHFLLRGRHFFWATDTTKLHSFTQSSKTAADRLHRTFDEFDEFRFTPVCVTGTAIPFADLLSRDRCFVDQRPPEFTGAGSDIVSAIVYDVMAADQHDGPAANAVPGTGSPSQAASAATVAATSNAQPIADPPTATLRKLSPAQLAQAQADDATLAEWTAEAKRTAAEPWAKGRATPPPDATTLIDKVLMRWTNGRWCVAIPEPYRMEAMKIIHLPNHSTSARLKSLSLTWPNATTEFDHYVKEQCQLCNFHARHHPRRVVGSPTEVVEPGARWQADVMMKTLPSSVNHHGKIATKYCLVATLIEESTGFVISRLLSAGNTAQMILMIDEMLIPLGRRIDLITSDQGSTFGKDWQRALQTCGVNTRFTAARDAAAGRAIVERCHRSLHELLLRRIDQCIDQQVEQSDGSLRPYKGPVPLARLIQDATLAHNSAHSRQHGCSPFFAFYGFDPSLPIGQLLEQLPTESGASYLRDGAIEWAATLTANRMAAHDQQQLLRAETNDSNQRAAAKHSKPFKFKVGDMVRISDPGSLKLRPPSYGPFRIETFNDEPRGSCRLSICGSIPTDLEAVSLKRLRPWSLDHSIEQNILAGLLEDGVNTDLMRHIPTNARLQVAKELANMQQAVNEQAAQQIQDEDFEVIAPGTSVPSLPKMAAMATLM